jgi:hypothetical protein
MFGLEFEYEYNRAHIEEMRRKGDRERRINRLKHERKQPKQS